MPGPCTSIDRRRGVDVPDFAMIPPLSRLVLPCLVGLSSALLSAAEKQAEPARINHAVNAPTFEGDRVRERQHYTLVPLPPPHGVVPEWTAVEVLPGDRLAVATRTGEVWLVHGAFADDVSRVRHTLFATGLHEPLSLGWRDGWLYVTERAGITRLRDTTGDGRSDEAEVITADWGFSGDDHEYAFSSRPDRDGSLWTVLCLSASVYSKAPWRGWGVRTTADGVMTPLVAGIRSPGGVGFNAAGDGFSTDNQGFWVGSSCLRQLKPGTYHGALPALEWWDQAGGKFGPRPVPPSTGRPFTDHRADPRYLPPAVYFPHQRLGHSPTGFDFPSDDRFGPFGSQLIVADHTYAHLQRVELEQVEGYYQGAVYPFFYGLDSGPIGVRFAADGSLFVAGCSKRGWGSRGPKPFHLDRIRWTGRTPFEVRSMRVWARGFDLEFTEKVDPLAAAATTSYALEAWTYLQSTRLREYGSSELDKLTPRITAVQVASDGRRIRLTVDPLTPGHVHELRLPGVRTQAGQTLVHPISWYTLNALPKTATVFASTRAVSDLSPSQLRPAPLHP